MAPKLIKGKNVVGIFSSTCVSALSLLPLSCVADFEKPFKHRIMVKQHVYDLVVAGELHIPKIVDIMEFQDINNCLKVSTNYNEDYNQGKDANFVFRCESTHIMLRKTHGWRYLLCLCSLITLHFMIITFIQILI